MNPLGTYFINQSHNPGKLTFVNAAAVHRLRRPFNFDCIHIHRVRSCKESGELVP